MKPVVIPADNTKITITRETRDGRPILVGKSRENYMQIKLCHDIQPRKKKGPNGGPLIHVHEWVMFNRQNNLISASTLERAGIIKILKSDKVEIRQGVKLNGSFQTYALAEIIHPDLLD